MNRTTLDESLPELLEAAMRVLPEYADKLDQMVQSALTIWDRRENKADSLTEKIKHVVDRNLDQIHKAALHRLGDEFRGLSQPLRQWIDKVSAAIEEGQLTEVQQMEFRLRLTELEMKYQTAVQVLQQFNIL